MIQVGAKAKQKTVELKLMFSDILERNIIQGVLYIIPDLYIYVIFLNFYKIM